jgi:hypothetical protein
MPLQATSGAASYDAFGGGVAAVPQYIEDVFSTWLYTGNGSTQTINNGIDLAGEGGLVWTKIRSNNNISFTPNVLIDTARGFNFSGTQIRSLFSNTTGGESDSTLNNAQATALSNGFSYATSAGNEIINGSGFPYVSWTFRKSPKFFDVVTGTADSSGNVVFNTTIDSIGFVVAKSTSNASQWFCYHRSLGNSGLLYLNSTSADIGIQRFTVSGSTVTLSDQAAGYQFVAYVFAHNAGGFGLTGTDNVISCGSYTGNGSLQTISLGYEPQWLLIKNATTGATNWSLIDCIRNSRLIPNLSNTEDNTGFAFSYETGDGTLRGAPTATGFQVGGGDSPGTADYNANGDTYIYIAIRRPMKTPTTGTSVFTPVAYTGTNVDNRLVDTGIVTDMTLARIRTATSGGGFYNASRMTSNRFLATATTDAITSDADSFMTPTLGAGVSFSAMNGFGVGNDATRQLNQSSTSQLAYAFQRAPGFFDVVCYTGTGVARTVAHNLAAVPELMIVKDRTTSWNWIVSGSLIGAANFLVLNGPNNQSANAQYFNNTNPTASVFTVGTQITTNGSGDNYVAYLFATCPGVSKVGSYTGTGTTQIINCGFTTGSRFVLIKRTDSSGDWYVWDSARGIVAGNDPYLLLNSTAAEVTNTDFIDTASTGFEISSTAPAAINASGGTFIFLAIA